MQPDLFACQAPRVDSEEQRAMIPPGRQARRDRIAHQRAVARDWAADWDREIDAFPEDELTILDTTRKLVAASKRPIGMAKVWELLRGKVKADLSNNYRAPAARRLMARHPDLVGKISIRSTPGDPSRAR